MKNIFKKFKSWSLPTRIGIITGIIGILITLIWGGLTISNNNLFSNNTNVEGQNNIVNSQIINNYNYNQTEIKWRESTKYLLVNKESLNNYCPNTITSIDSQFESGTINFWFKNINYTLNFIEDKPNQTFIVETGYPGKIKESIFYKGPTNLNFEKKTILHSKNQQSEILIYYKNNHIFFEGHINNSKFLIDSFIKKPSEWNFISISWNKKGEKKIYINSQLITEVKNKDSFNFGNVLKDISIGSTLEKTDCLNGAIDEFSTYNRDLSNSEIKQLYNFGKGCSIYTQKCGETSTFFFMIKWYLKKLLN